jgi:hypothetical protein
MLWVIERGASRHEGRLRAWRLISRPTTRGRSTLTATDRPGQNIDAERTAAASLYSPIRQPLPSISLVRSGKSQACARSFVFRASIHSRRSADDKARGRRFGDPSMREISRTGLTATTPCRAENRMIPEMMMRDVRGSRAGLFSRESEAAYVGRARQSQCEPTPPPY